MMKMMRARCMRTIGRVKFASRSRGEEVNDGSGSSSAAAAAAAVVVVVVVVVVVCTREGSCVLSVLLVKRNLLFLLVLLDLRLRKVDELLNFVFRRYAAVVLSVRARSWLRRRRFRWDQVGEVVRHGGWMLVRTSAIMRTGLCGLLLLLCVCLSEWLSRNALETAICGCANEGARDGRDGSTVTHACAQRTRLDHCR